MKFVGIVVWYNPNDEDIECTKKNCVFLEKMIVIDNSKVSNFHAVKNIENIQYHCFYENEGLGKALNTGVQIAEKMGYKWLITFDQDSVMKKGFINEYEYYIENHTNSLPFMLTPQYDIERKRNKKNKERFSKVNYSMQSGCAFNLEYLIKMGGFYEEYFIECIDFEICFRASKYKMDIIRCNKAILVHKPAIQHSIKIISKEIHVGIASPLRYYYQCRNLCNLFMKYKKLILLKYIIQKMAKVVLIFPQKREYLKMMYRGFSDGIKGTLEKYEG